MKIEDIDFNGLQELLQQLGIFLKDVPCGRNKSIYFLKTLDMEYSIGLKAYYENHKRCHSAWSNFESLKDEIFKYADFFIYVRIPNAYANQIAMYQIFKENPYFGTKTFEEAMIKKDLLENVSV